MNRLKEKLLGGLSVTTVWILTFLFQLIALMLLVVPLWIMDMSPTLRYILYIICGLSAFFVPSLASFLSLVFWVISIPTALRLNPGRPLTIYLICAVIYVVFELLPTLVNLFGKGERS